MSQKTKRQLLLQKILSGRSDANVRFGDKFAIILYWSNQDRAFIAEVPELPGCMAHGDSQEAALKHVNEAIQLWIDTAQEFGDPVSQPKGERIMLA